MELYTHLFLYTQRLLLYACHGDPDIVTTPTPPVVLSGGGTDVDEAFRRMCRANNGGDILVLGTATFNKYYYSYIRNLCINAGKPANSVAILIVPDATAAGQKFVYDTIVAAETIWIAGGDQSDYVKFWTNTPAQTNARLGVQKALNDRIALGAVIGGISAGMNVLTEFVYSAEGTTTVTSSFALANPDSPSITLRRSFLNVGALAGLIGDPHFVTRDRMGRDLAFLYRIFKAFPGAAARAVSVDEATAVIVSGTIGNWTAEVVGTGNAYFLQPTAEPVGLGTGSPLTGITVRVCRVGPGATFIISSADWQQAGSYEVSAQNGVLRSTQSGNAIY